jgi:hypothetical protein
VERQKGRLEIVYDEVDKVWRGFTTVKVKKPLEEAVSSST